VVSCGVGGKGMRSGVRGTGDGSEGVVVET